MAYHGHTHKVSGCRHINLLMCPISDSQSWSHMTERYYLKNFCKSVQKQRQEGKGEERKITRMAIAQPLALHTNTINLGSK